MNPLYADVASRAGHRCEDCRAPESIFNFPFEVEHVIPPGQGGTDESTNLALACRSCNLRKGTHVTGTDPETNTTTDLFHPRRHDWSAHFRAEKESGTMVGLTTMGRATVVRLDMNSPTQLTARVQWGQLGLFPESMETMTMSLTLELPPELADALAAEASRLGLSLPEYAVRLLASARTPPDSVRSGAELVEYWKSEGIIGSRPDIIDAPTGARVLREQAQRRSL